MKLWHACPKWLGLSPAAPIFISFVRPASLCCEDYTYIEYLTAYETVHELSLLPNNTTGGTFLHKSGAVRSADWIFIAGVPAWR